MFAADTRCWNDVSNRSIVLRFVSAFRAVLLPDIVMDYVAAIWAPGIDQPRRHGERDITSVCGGRGGPRKGPAISRDTSGVLHSVHAGLANCASSIRAPFTTS